MCPDNLTEFSRQERLAQHGIRTVQVHQVSGKKALKAYFAKRRLQEENKENIPPVLHREDANKKDDNSKDTEYVVHQEEGHDDSREHVPT